MGQQHEYEITTKWMDEVGHFANKPKKLKILSTHICDSTRTCDSYGQLEETICGLYFACITWAYGFGMVHFIMDDSSDLSGPHYG